ncbi:MAG: FAD-dependent oxidoreductase [Verrucomicrobia bacterium]|nr:FAD-dependent oxidoreductase [Verrucomicrobiota bacterium]
MNDHSGEHESLWMATEIVPHFPPLNEDTTADVCIVGAGIAGISTAYMLSLEGKSVVVLDDGDIGSGETERTTSHLSNAFDDRYCEVARMHGEHAAQLIADSHSTAIARIEANAVKEKINCEFERLDGFLFVAPGESTAILERELEACHRAGLMDVEWVESAPINSFNTGPCLRFPRQGQMHPTKYLHGLAQAFVRRGGRIYCGTHVAKIESGDPGRVRTSSSRTVEASSVVVATNSPVNDKVAIHTKQAPYRTYVIGARIPRDSVRRALYWDTLDPYHYVRLQRNNDAFGEEYDVLVVGGEDHKTGQLPELGTPFANLENWARHRFPMMQDIEFRWSGQVMEPTDGLAFIGRNPGDTDNIYICTGDSGQGMTHGTIASILLTDLIAGRPNEWSTVYDPSRVTMKSVGEFARENLNVARKYGQWLLPGEVRTVDEIPPDSGAIIRRGMVKVAVYRSKNGELYEKSATCPHLGCILQWNNIEKSWDCPCHGSRFEKFGAVVNGPSIHDMKAVKSHFEEEVPREQ